MSINKFAVVLLYATIFVLLVSPNINLSQNMIEIGPLNIYLFEFPLLCAFVVSFVVFLLRKPFSIGKNIFGTYSLFFVIAIIGIIGASMYSTVGIEMILKDCRDILYWSSGVIIIFVGHKYLKLKTLVRVVACGLLSQMLAALVMVKSDPSILLLHRFRFPGRTGWFTLFFVALFFMMITYRKRLLVNGRYQIAHVMIILVPLLVHILLSQNRTTWIVLFLMTSYWLIFYTNFVSKIRFSIMVVIIILLITVGFQITPHDDAIEQYLYKRIFHGTLSEEGVKDVWEGNRELIYRSNLSDFQKHPIFGNGFGYQMYFDTSDPKKEDKSVSKVDNSFVNVLIKTGLAGLIIFIVILYNMYLTIKKTLNFIEDSEDWIYLKAMLFVSPFFVLISLNISILYGYPEVIIFSLFFAKTSMMRQLTLDNLEHCR